MPKKLAGLAPRRKLVGLTQAQLAEALGVERATVTMWELGNNWPSARVLPLIADLLVCSIDELYYEPEEEAGASESRRWRD
ncbi:MAG: helix-turn-helix transcriptional regulator [Oscillospiraceae bacterium]|nr:helix-turn-helix transcriptional regulator [Oscillospiraceae bacterium]